MKTQQIKKVPLRKCVITGNQLPKKELIRIVREPSGNVVIDETGKVRGHGVYLSRDKSVINKAKNKHTLDRYLEVKVDDKIYEQLLESVSSGNNEV